MSTSGYKRLIKQYGFSLFSIGWPYLWKAIKWALDDYGYIQITQNAIDKRGAIVRAMWWMLTSNWFGPVIGGLSLAVIALLEFRRDRTVPGVSVALNVSPAAQEQPEQQTVVVPASTRVARTQANVHRASAEAMEKWLESRKPKLEVFRIHSASVELGPWHGMMATVIGFTNTGHDASNLVAHLQYDDTIRIPYGYWVDERCHSISLKRNHTKELVVGSYTVTSSPTHRSGVKTFYVWEDRRRCDESYTLRDVAERVIGVSMPTESLLRIVLRADDYEREFLFDIESNQEKGIVCNERKT